MRPVQTANWIGSEWVVTGGLKSGDAVIVDNLMKLRPGVVVQPKARGEGPANAQQSVGENPPAGPPQSPGNKAPGSGASK
jgi:membrane fusion protein (multidrug efflux system)